ncbi:MAG: hypothetical protein KDA89_15255 [Planctomycetaceae bacterium]|nr:hypothetical protein [Planctomycetaceae bacterium]
MTDDDGTERPHPGQCPGRIVIQNSIARAPLTDDDGNLIGRCTVESVWCNVCRRRPEHNKRTVNHTVNTKRRRTVDRTTGT